MDTRWKQRFNNFTKAHQHLEKAVSLYKERGLSELETQGLIKAFEFTIELSWNILKDYLEEMGFQEIIGSKNAIRQACKSGLLENAQNWIDMIEDRNLSAQTYNEEIAAQVATNIAELYIVEFAALKTTFTKLLEKT